MNDPKFLGSGTYSCVYRPAVPCSINSPIINKETKYVSSLDHIEENQYGTEKQKSLFDKIKTNISDWEKYYILPIEKCYYTPNIENKFLLQELMKCQTNNKTQNYMGKEIKRNTIYEYGGISLRDLINNKIKYRDHYNDFCNNILEYIKHLLLCINKINLIGIVHGDIKLENIVINIEKNVSPENIKLIDWDLISHYILKPFSAFSTYIYWPPEQILLYRIITNWGNLSNLDVIMDSFMYKYFEIIINQIPDILQNQIPENLNNFVKMENNMYKITNSSIFHTMVTNILIELNDKRFIEKEYYIIDSFAIGMVIYQLINDMKQLIKNEDKIFLNDLVSKMITFLPLGRLTSNDAINLIDQYIMQKQNQSQTIQLDTSQQGGNVNYFHKYCKYKQKYLNLIKSKKK